MDNIMLNVFLATLPVCGFAVYVFGLAALLTIVTALTSCVATEYLFSRSRSSQRTVRDWSAAVTGILYGLTLPPSLPVWMVAVGGFMAIGIGKALFGGLGANPFNPALVGRALLQAAFPVAMTTWPVSSPNRWMSLPASTLTPPFLKPAYDAVSAPTPLAGWKFEQLTVDVGDLFLGTVSGSTGETSSLLILLGGAYLVSRRMMSWRIPLAILMTVGALSGGLQLLNPDRYAGPLFMICSGGLVLGAVFMATDPVGSPMTHTGCWLFGILIGVLVVVIRVWGGMPEGVMYAILLSNTVTPHIDNWVQPRVFGTGRLPNA